MYCKKKTDEMPTLTTRLTKNTDEKVDLINYDFSWNTLKLVLLGKKNNLCQEKG